MTSYLTLARDGDAEIEVKRSRFRCTLARVEVEADARAVVERLRREHWDARHHCSAFVLGPDAAVQRSSDDGEPAGTAGAPMLEVLRGREVSDVVAVVTRWFGGVLLGAGGLVRAYGDAVRAALDEVGVQHRRLLAEWAIDLGHAEAGRVESDLRSRGITVVDAAYADRVTLRLAAPPEEETRLHAVLAELTGGGAVPRPVGERWVDEGRSLPA
ncbi:MAG: YigZ family protein [Nocardioidaceae bacterium]|nr:YigZ family protein [Nocardioidaceae bacterium]